jgi:hypothetical protein
LVLLVGKVAAAEPGLQTTNLAVPFPLTQLPAQLELVRVFVVKLADAMVGSGKSVVLHPCIKFLLRKRALLLLSLPFYSKISKQ